MANARAIIQKTTANGPWAYSFSSDAEALLQDTIVNNVASASAAIDAIKALVPNVPGVLTRITISIQTV
jgi:hypothetical protein